MHVCCSVCHVNIVGMCCPFDTYTITNKETKANTEAIPFYSLKRVLSEKVFYAWHVRRGISSHYIQISVEVYFNFILCLFTCMHVMPTHPRFLSRCLRERH